MSSSRPHSKGILPLILFTIFVDMIGFGILIPVIPQLFVNPASPDFVLTNGEMIGLGYILLGLLSAIFPLAQFFATPILGELSDKHGRKKLLALSIGGSALSYAIFALGVVTKNIPLLFFSRAFAGFTGGNIAIAQAAIADITTPGNRAKNFGLMGAAFGFGFVVGPFFGGKLADPEVLSWFNASTPFWFAAILSFANMLSVLLFLPETHHALSKKKLEWSRAFKNILKAYTYKDLRPLFATTFIFFAGFTFYTTFFSVFLIDRFHLSQSAIGEYFAYSGIWIAITQGLVTRIVAKRFKEDTLLRVSYFAIGIILLLYFIPTVVWELYFLVPFFALFVGLVWANSTALLSRSVGPEVQGEILGINSSVQALAQTIPPVLAGFVAAHLSPTSPIIVSSLVIILAGLIFIMFYKRSPAPYHEKSL